MPTPAQSADLRSKGYFIARGLIDTATIAAIRRGLLRQAETLARTQGYRSGDRLLEGVAKTDPEAVPLHQRFRKLNGLADVAEVWNGWYAHPAVIAHLCAWLGSGDILSKFTSAFLKPAKIGGPTPWHQDISLWRDRNHDAANGWLAIDPATRANACLQVVPGSHLGPAIPHVEYDDSVHGELPRDRCVDLVIDHIELAPGDAVFWHSNLWHHSPPNTSDQDRMGVGAVWISPDQIPQVNHTMNLRWAARGGTAVPHPAPRFIVDAPATPAPLPVY